MSFESSISQRGDDELDTCSIISFGSHRSNNKASSAYKNQQQLEVKVETVYSLLFMLTCNNIKEEMCNKFYSMSLDKRISLEMRSHGCIPLLIQLIHPIGEDTRENNGDFDYDDNDGCNELEIRNKAAIALRNIVKYSEDTKAGKKEIKVLQLLEEIRGFCDKFKRGKGDLSISMDHPSEATSHLMKISFDEEHRVAICLLGGLHAIAELIFFDTKYHGNTTSPQCITVRRYAFMALTNLTFGDGTNKSILCSNKLFIRSLIEQLYSPSEELRQVTASVLRNLSWKADDQGKDTLREMGAVRMLMRAALEARKESTLKSILTALWNLSAHSTTNKAEICAVEGALKFLVSTLNYQSPNNTMVIIENGGGILRNVSSYIARHEHLRTILREFDTLFILLEQLKSPSLTIVSNACATLWNLSARCLQDQLKLVELGAIPMLRNLVNSKHKMISMGSAAALKNLSSVKNFHEADSSCSSSSRNSSCSPNTTSTPTLLARKTNNFRPELDDSLSETCDNLESPKSSPAHVRRFQPPPPISRYDLPDRMYTSFTVPTLSNPYPYMSKSSSKDSLGSTHSEPVYYPFNQTHNLPNNNGQIQLAPTLSRSSSHGFNPPLPPVSQNISSFSNDLSHLFHAYPIKVAGDNWEKNQPSTLVRTNSDSFDKTILENAQRNVESLLSSQKGQLFTSCLNSLQSGVKSASDDNVTLATKDSPNEQPRRKLSVDGSESEIVKQASDCEGLDKLTKSISEGRSLNRLTYTCSRPTNKPTEFKSPCNLIELPSINSKKVKSEIIEEENEEILKKEETVTKSSDDNELITNPAQNISIISQNQSISFGDNCITSTDVTPLMFSRTSSLGSISGLEAKSNATSQSSVRSEFSKIASGPVSPTDLPDSPTQTESLTCLLNGYPDDKIQTNVQSFQPFDLKAVEKIHCFGAKSSEEHLKSNQEKISGLISTQINESICTKVEKATQIINQVQEACNRGIAENNMDSMKGSNSNDILSQPIAHESISLYSLESSDINSIKPPSCIDEASLSLESSNFQSMEFTTKPAPPKVVSTILSAQARKNGNIEGLLESTNPPSDMDAISGLSSSCGSINSIDSELNDLTFPVVKEFDLEATKLIAKQTQDIIQLTESHNDPSNVPPKPTLQRTDTFNCDGQNESEDDSKATYVCSPRKARIVKPVLRIQPSNNQNNNDHGNSFIRRFNSSSSSSSSTVNHSSNDSIVTKNKSIVIKRTKTTTLRANRSKSTHEVQNENSNTGHSTSVPTTPVKKASSNGNFSSKTFVVRKRVGNIPGGTSENDNCSNINTINASGIKNRSVSTNKMCNSASIHNIDKMNGNFQSSVLSGHNNSSTISSLNKKTPVQSKIASLWKRSHPEKENVTTQGYVPPKGDNSSNLVKSNKATGTGKTIPTSSTTITSPSNSTANNSSPATVTLTRSSTYEKLPTSPSEAIKMQSNLPPSRKETKEMPSRVPLTKNRIRPAQDQITATLKQSKIVRLEKRKASLVN
uniref:Adenomatous polyposis coli protein n=1 Tax=Tetranychus urticae TaxID=32264 RepID=T1KM92_TETUR